MLLRLSLLLLLPGLVSAGEPWATYRGNPQRTGNGDGKAGPARPNVLWVHRSSDHFIASPVPAGQGLFVSGFSGFNVPSVSLLALDGQAPKRVLWSKAPPVLKLPTVSSPALSQGKLIFGDGMHQTDGAILRCLRADNGRLVWSLPLPGELVHLEGGPTVERGKVYLGAGSGGVLCVDLNRVTLDGKEQDLPAIQKLLDQKWEALLRQYEKDKKADPELAIPPTEDRLPQPAPVVLWKQGEKKWHVDAPVVVLDNRVLVCSAFLDKEKMGDRALFSLEASTGKVQWRTPLALNPWGGASVQGKRIVVAGSSVGYDLGALKGARGEIGAYELETGKQKWKKAVPGGIVSSLALSSDAAVCTATDGKVRAFELADGERRWIYDARAPFFAPPAIAGDVVYAADLKGVLHAIGLKDGTPLWKLDLAADRTVQAPGQVYGGPIVQGGRLYVATCNLGPEFRGKPTAVVCIGQR